MNAVEKVLAVTAVVAILGIGIACVLDDDDLSQPVSTASSRVPAVIGSSFGVILVLAVVVAAIEVIVVRL